MNVTLRSAAVVTLVALFASTASAQCPTPSNYCSSLPNSVGAGAVMSWTGTPSILADDFHLVAEGCPPGEPLLFYYGAGQIDVAFGNGRRCVGAGGVGTFRFPMPQTIDAGGTASQQVNYQQPPVGVGTGMGAWLPGSTWNCQAWFRDPAAGGFNLSDGLEVEVCVGVFAEDFDAVSPPALPANWTIGANAPADAGTTTWELGAPSLVGPSAADSPPNCFGTNIDDFYGANTDIWLRTPSIDLTGSNVATLSFMEFKDIEDSGIDQDYGSIRILSAQTLSELAILEAAVEGSSSTGWESYAISLPPAAFAEPILIEFRLHSDAADQSGGVENGGFELPVLSDGNWNTTGGPGWSVITNAGGIWNPDSGSGFPGGAVPAGQNLGWVGGASGAASGGGLSQVVQGSALEANTQYVVSAQVGNPLFNPGSAGAPFRIELLAGGVLQGALVGTSPVEGQWQAESLVYDSGPAPAQLGQPFEIRLLANGADEVDFDQVAISGVSGSAAYAGWYIDDVEIRLEDPSPGSWQVLPNSPLAPYYHHDDLFFIDDLVGWICNISGEIWKTTDGGDNWTRVWNQPGTSFRTITFRDEMNGWVGNLGIGGWVAGITDPNVLYSTADGGLNWTAVTNISGTVPDGVCGMQAIGPDTIHGCGRYAGDAYFISSTDGGASWTSTDMNTDFNAFVDLLFFTPDIGYMTSANAAGDAALLYTTDGGANWTTEMTSDAYHYWKVGFASDTFGYAVCWAGNDADKWIQTYDGGQSWTSRQFAGLYEANGIGFLDEQVGWIGGHEVNTYETLDGGDTWDLFQIDTVYGDYINTFLRVSDDVIYAVGNRIYKYSTDPVVLPLVSGPVFDNSLCELTATPSGPGSTTLTYTVPEDDNVQITIYERGGLIFDRPVDEPMRAGTYRLDVVFGANAPRLFAAIVTGDYRQRIGIHKP